nr:MAG TPA: hypothetical protein [Caudoviricetes sp.]
MDNFNTTSIIIQYHSLLISIPQGLEVNTTSI